MATLAAPAPDFDVLIVDNPMVMDSNLGLLADVSLNTANAAFDLVADTIYEYHSDRSGLASIETAFRTDEESPSTNGRSPATDELISDVSIFDLDAHGPEVVNQVLIYVKEYNFLRFRELSRKFWLF